MTEPQTKRLGLMRLQVALLTAWLTEYLEHHSEKLPPRDGAIVAPLFKKLEDAYQSVSPLASGANPFSVAGISVEFSFPEADVLREAGKLWTRTKGSSKQNFEMVEMVDGLWHSLCPIRHLTPSPESDYQTACGLSNQQRNENFEGELLVVETLEEADCDECKAHVDDVQEWLDRVGE